MKRIGTEWWKEYFDEDFYRIYRGVLDEDEPAIAAEAIIELLDLQPGARVLDLACGWGRHAFALQAAGLDVVGLDRALPLLRRAAASGDDGGPAWVCGDLRRLPFRGSLDAIVCLYSSLGYFPNDEDDLNALVDIRSSLKEDGLFLLETVHRDAVVRDYAERDWWHGDEGETIFVEREFDAVAGVTREVLRWTSSEGAIIGEKHHAARIRSATEWDELLRAAGLEPLGWYGGWDCRPFDHTSPMLLVLSTPRSLLR